MILFLALLTGHYALAYSFTADGFYYNITSENTVEVTYKEHFTNNPEYSGNITIKKIYLFSIKIRTTKIKCLQ